MIISYTIKRLCKPCTVISYTIKRPCKPCMIISHTVKRVCKPCIVISHTVKRVCKPCTVISHTVKRVCKPCMVISHTATAPCKPCTVISHTATAPASLAQSFHTLRRRHARTPANAPPLQHHRPLIINKPAPLPLSKPYFWRRDNNVWGGHAHIAHRTTGCPNYLLPSNYS